MFASGNALKIVAVILCRILILVMDVMPQWDWANFALPDVMMEFDTFAAHRSCEIRFIRFRIEVKRDTPVNRSNASPTFSCPALTKPKPGTKIG